jgi:hypothetical protein
MGGDFHSTVELFDLKTLRTVPTSIPMPSRKPKRRALAAATIGNRIVIAGGLGQGGFREADLLAEVDELDTQSGRWCRLPDLPQPRFSPGMCAVDGTLYLAGGFYSAPNHNPVADFNDILVLKDQAPHWYPHVERLAEPKSFVDVLNISPSTIALIGGHDDLTDKLPRSTFQLLNTEC